MSQAQTAAILSLAETVDVLARALAEAPTEELVADLKAALDKQARIVGECVTLLREAEDRARDVRVEDLREVLNACRINP